MTVAELSAEAEFLEKRQSAKIHEEKFKIEEEYPKSKVKVKILEVIESEDHKREFNVDGQYKGEVNKAIDEKLEIQHQRTKQYHMIKQLLVMRSSTSVFSSSRSMR